MDNFSSPTPTNSDAKTAAIVSYITIIGWLIAYFALYKDKKSSLAGFHLRQSLMLHIISFVLYIITRSIGYNPGFMYIIWAVQILLLIAWILGLIAAINSEEKPIPVIGSSAQSAFKSI